MTVTQTPDRLPKGPHDLTRDQVQASQRERILDAILDAVGEHGYAATTVAHVTKAAGISRTTFYEQFRSKEDAFLTAYDAFGERFLADMTRVTATSPGRGPVRRRRAAGELGADGPNACRAFLLEIYSVGEAGLQHRDRRCSLPKSCSTAWWPACAASIPACRRRHASSGVPWWRRPGSSPLKPSGPPATPAPKRAKPSHTSGCSD